MTTEVKTGEWVLCRGMAILVTAAEIDAALAHGYKQRKNVSRRLIAENIALGKRIGTYRDWSKKDDCEASR